ncbi:protein phosphatase [Lentibacillus halodurans]|uniref:protein-serine/threonine phosphatase n=1 Tax=Lentibacillus halodurans TaxID=237679 RepID=A0A1I0Z4Y3_9BACI|nr:Stp1/IreP family PP2C-type Ser/Thr phosphatase [Lentibacillus halodurans]SFB19660.1 protein phosphatase [Lentibacillus halodurans]
MKAHFQTDQGQIRHHNEDAGGVFYNESGQLLAVIADGMGGHQAGDVASQIATSFIRDQWEQTDEFDQPEETEVWLKENIQEMNRSILEHAQDHEECAGMGTTVVAAICTEAFIAVGHIGDSRCYILSEDEFRQITEDHSLVNELVRSGQISKDDAEQHPRKNVLLKALGTEADITADVQSIEWNFENQLLLCSDGLTNKLSDDELLSLIQKDQDLETTCNEMVDFANERGGEDNISLIIVHHDGAMEEGDA